MKRPKLNIEEQIAHLEHRGIDFKHTSKDNAKIYLRENNNFFKLTAYRKNFPKHPGGSKMGKYVDLDFAYLQDLAILDMRLRYLLIHMCLDVEHFSKVRLMKALEESPSDGYDVVNSFIERLDSRQKEILINEIERNHENPYCGALKAKYASECPAWVFIEIIPFGRYINFYKHCADFFKNKSMQDEYYLFLFIRELRNAAAHNNCILNDLRPDTTEYTTNFQVSAKLSKSISKHIYQKKMSNVRIQQIITLFYAYTKLVPSKGAIEHQCSILNDFSIRLLENKDYYKNNPMVLTTFSFLKTVIDSWFPTGYNES